MKKVTTIVISAVEDYELDPERPARLQKLLGKLKCRLGGLRSAARKGYDVEEQLYLCELAVADLESEIEELITA